MHALHRPDLAHAAAIVAACAALAVLLTLLFGATLNDFGSTSPFDSPGAPPTTVPLVRARVELESIHEPVALARPDPVVGVATLRDADGDRR